MRLSEALQIVQRGASEADPGRNFHLVCGFTPLHLQTFLCAYAGRRFPGVRIGVVTGYFDDLEGNLDRAAAAEAEGAAVVIEWSDLDPRLGLRASAGWSAAVLADVPRQVAERLERLAARIEKLAALMPVAYAGPTLALPPMAPPAGDFELGLRLQAAAFAHRIASLSGTRVVSEAALTAERHDVAMDLRAGFPYTLKHADALAAALADGLFPAPPKKGLITDLDDTLWKGILGEAGVGGVSWDLASQSQQHALYQQLLASLAESGVLIAAASKNDPALVRQAFERPDLLLKPGEIFPIEAHWGAKSESVRRILAAWNIAATDVVFVDDSRMELAEVAERHPGMTCLCFPAGDAGAVLALLRRLRTLFAKPHVSAEDRLRLESLRGRAAFEEARSAEAEPGFFSRLDATVTLEFSSSPDDPRAFDLVNKTNQFNLNGRRFTDREWRAYFQAPGAFLVTASYEDRFGPLGKIAVLAGRRQQESIHVDVWVMSCRAFSRHIEYQVLARLFQRWPGCAIAFAYQATERNGPVREFTGRLSPPGVPLSAACFAEVCPDLHHRVVETHHG